MQLLHVSISNGNQKMGDIKSVSLPAGLTCRMAPCQGRCYARRLGEIRPNVREAYRRNYQILLEYPDQYWREVEAAIMLSRFFRFHVSGDIPNPKYLKSMMAVTARHPHCQVLCFTKRYEIVNGYLDSGGQFPGNLHLLFSAWAGLQMVNPYSLPEAHVRYRDGTTTAAHGALECSGNCSECATTDSGCWTLGRGEQVIFNEH